MCISRFPADESCMLTAFSALSMRPIGLLSHEDLAKWGNEKLDTLLSHYGAEKVHKWDGGETTSPPLVDSHKAREEWTLVKEVVRAQDYPRDSLANLWGMLAMYHRDQFPTLIKLASFALTCPAQTADCERGFSAQNRIMTCLRNRLLPETQNKLLLVKLGQANVHKALDLWAKSKKRLITNSTKRQS